MKLDGLIVREAQPEDYDALLALEQKVVEAERPFNADLKETGVHYYDIHRLISDQSTRMIVAELSGTIVATGYMQVRDSKSSLTHDKHGYLGFMYVAQEYRGLGLNKIVVQDLVDWGQSRGIRHFYLDVYADNAAAVRAYEKFGFQPSLIEMKLVTLE